MAQANPHYFLFHLSPASGVAGWTQSGTAPNAVWAIGILRQPQTQRRRVIRRQGVRTANNGAPSVRSVSAELLAAPPRFVPHLSMRPPSLTGKHGGRDPWTWSIVNEHVRHTRRYPGPVAKSRIRVARVYDDPDPDEGQRILVDRVWPRGFRKDDPRVGAWYKDVAPSTELRGWYNHQPERFEEFAARYKKELQGNEALDKLRKLTKRGVVTLVTATRDLDGSQAAVLAKLLKHR
jgi:uncharacterized protein YeaO (DUF488 family)